MRRGRVRDRRRSPVPVADLRQADGPAGVSDGAEIARTYHSRTSATLSRSDRLVPTARSRSRSYYEDLRSYAAMLHWRLPPRAPGQRVEFGPPGQAQGETHDRSARQ